jgi:hypothetical protein
MGGFVGEKKIYNSEYIFFGGSFLHTLHPNKISKFLCGHRKGHSPSSTLIVSVDNLLFVVTSAHTLLEPVHTLCLAWLAVQIDTTYTQSWFTNCAWTSCTAVHL